MRCLRGGLDHTRRGIQGIPSNAQNAGFGFGQILKPSVVGELSIAQAPKDRAPLKVTAPDRRTCCASRICASSSKQFSRNSRTESPRHPAAAAAAQKRNYLPSDDEACVTIASTVCWDGVDLIIVSALRAPSARGRDPDSSAPCTAESMSSLSRTKASPVAR